MAPMVLEGLNPKCASSGALWQETLRRDNPPRLIATLQEIALAGDIVMYRSGGQQMSHIIEFVIVQVSPVFFVIAKLHRRTDIAVVLLRLRDQINQFI